MGNRNSKSKTTQPMEQEQQLYGPEILNSLYDQLENTSVEEEDIRLIMQNAMNSEEIKYPLIICISTKKDQSNLLPNVQLNGTTIVSGYIRIALSNKIIPFEIEQMCLYYYQSYDFVVVDGTTHKHIKYQLCSIISNINTKQYDVIIVILNIIVFVSDLHKYVSSVTGLDHERHELRSDLHKYVYDATGLARNFDKLKKDILYRVDPEDTNVIFNCTKAVFEISTEGFRTSPRMYWGINLDPIFND
eukprot:366039_1